MPDTEKALGLSVLSTIRDWVKALIPKKAAGIPYGECDATSTSTIFTATVTGITEYYDGLTVMLKNGVVTSAANFTININSLGAKPCYNNMATGNDITPTAPTRDTTIFNINYTMLFVYSEDIVSGGGWICYRGYDANTNTIGYQIRTNSTLMKTYDKCRYYRMFFTAADGTHWVPANTGTDNSATSVKTVNQRPIDPFGRIVYFSANTNMAAEANVSATSIWDQYTFALGYSFNTTGAALTLTTQIPVYVKCTPQSDGSAIIDSTTPIVQALPSTADGKIYIYLGIAYSATNIEMVQCHPVYEYKDGAIRLWTNAAAGGSTVSVTQTVTSGTELATVTVDNIGTKIYAPSYSALTTQEIEDAVDAAYETLYDLTVESGSITFYATATGSDEKTLSDQITEAAEDATVYILFVPSGMQDLVVKEQSTQATITATYIGYTGASGAVYEFTMPADDVVASAVSSGPPTQPL